MKSLSGKPHRGIIIFLKTERSLDRDYEEGLGIFLLPYFKKCFCIDVSTIMSHGPFFFNHRSRFWVDCRCSMAILHRNSCPESSISLSGCLGVWWGTRWEKECLRFTVGVPGDPESHSCTLASSCMLLRFVLKKQWLANLFNCIYVYYVSVHVYRHIISAYV